MSDLTRSYPKCLKDLIDLCDEHGVKEGWEAQVGDLEEILIATWLMMTAQQQVALLHDDAVESIFTTVRGEEEEDHEHDGEEEAHPQ